MRLILSFLLILPSLDSNVFKDSSIGRKCARGYFGNGFLLCDSGYGCTTHLITPCGTPETPKEVLPYSYWLRVGKIK
jgi:hypothetical protein